MRRWITSSKCWPPPFAAIGLSGNFASFAPTWSRIYKTKLNRLRKTSPVSNIPPADLFDTYVHLQDLLKDEIFSIEDEHNRDHNHQALAESYNSFVKLTRVWFTLEMKQIIGSWSSLSVSRAGSFRKYFLYLSFAEEREKDLRGRVEERVV